MAHIDWRLKGPEISACNCAWGCPCQFNSLPTHGNCRATVAMRIDEGHFGEVLLDGLLWAGVFAWPGAIHEGHGESQVVVDERADERQRTALLTILAGRETDPGATIFNVMAGTLETIHPPQFRPIEFEIDVESRTARFAVQGLVEANTEPMRNPVTGEPHFAQVSLPGGFEFAIAEFASSTVTAGQPVPHEWQGRHAHLATLDLGPHGPSR